MMAVDLGTAFADQGDTATIMTQTNVPVVATTRSLSQNTDDIGDMMRADLSLVVQTSSLTVTPAIDALVTFLTVSYRIGGIDYHPDGNAITLNLRHVTQ
jgi:hypothetical protein